MNKRLTGKEIAQIAGVSPTTVSLVRKGKSGVSEEKRKEILQLLKEYQVKECYFGHLHGYAAAAAWQGESDGIRFRLVSADALKFSPLRIR